MSNTPTKDAPTTPAKAAEPKDPLAPVHAAAEHVLESLDALLAAGRANTARAAACLDHLATVRNKVGLAERELRNPAKPARR